MKRTMALLIAAALLLAAMPAVLAEDGKAVTARSMDLNRISNTFAYRGENDSYYQVLDADGTALTEKDTGYRSMSINSSYGFYKVEVSSEDGVHDEGLLDGRGKLLVPAVYADVDVVSDRWQVGIKLTPCEADDKDYTFSNWSTGEKLFFRVDTADFYFDGKLAGTLPRTDYGSATAYGAYVAVRNQAREVTFYNSSMEASPRPADGSGEYDEEYANRVSTFYHQGSGQVAFVPECTLKAEDVDDPYLYRDGTVYDLQGNALFTTARKYDTVRTFRNGYALVRLERKYGLIDLQGNEVIPPEYDDLGGYSYDNLLQFGYISAVKDEKIGFLDAQGKETAGFTYAANAARDRSTFAEIKNLDGTVIVLSAAVGELPEHYAEVTFPSSSGCKAFVAKNAQGQLGVVDLYGVTQVPFGDYRSVSVSLDGTLALVNTGSREYTVYHLEVKEPPVTEKAPDQPADDGTWTCENGHSGNTGKFCPECGAARPE